MKIFLTVLSVIILASSVFAVSDTGVLGAKKTLGYFLMPSTSFSHCSSGLVYNQKDDDRWETEVLYTSYRSFYLITSNITQLVVHKRYKVAQWGGFGISALAGGGIIYSPAVGGGAIGDAGGLFTLRLSDSLALAAPVYFSIFTDGFNVYITPDFNYKLPFWNEKELFGGFRFEADVVGNPGSSGSSGSAKLNTYFVLGLRGAL